MKREEMSQAENISTYWLNERTLCRFCLEQGTSFNRDKRLQALTVKVEAFCFN